jgi:hypothetical protein
MQMEKKKIFQILIAIPVTIFVCLVAEGQLKVPAKGKRLDVASSEQTLVLNANQLFENWISRDIKLSTDSEYIDLESGEVFEDDGPAAGYTYTPNKEKLSNNIWARKQLIVPNPRAYSAKLLIEHTEKPTVTINGQTIDLLQGGGEAWKIYSFDPALLRQGSNDIIVSGKGVIPIALDQNYAANLLTHPNRSARSTDGGRTWDYAHLGTDGNIDGEYYVRLFLEHYRSTGTLISPVIDAGNLMGKTISPALSALLPVKVLVKSRINKGGKIFLLARSGTTIVPSEKDWSSWQEISLENGRISQPKGRYIQLSLELSTTDPLKTPELKSVEIAADYHHGSDWTENVKLISKSNKEIIRSIIDFKYEPFKHPTLARFRKQYQLDSVVKGAANELEIITRLAGWASQRWKRSHLNSVYPPWDALEILKIHKDGTPIGGFCQHNNVLLLQACESFGLVGRAVSMSPGGYAARKAAGEFSKDKDWATSGGHEVVEIWCNQFNKWVYVDGQMAWYATNNNNVPLSLMELHKRQIDLIQHKKPDSTTFITIIPGSKKWESLTDWPPFIELRLIPRSNFLEQAAPLPLNQGMQGWPWTGHELWVDNKTCPTLLYPKRLRRPGNWEWTINQAHFTIEATGTPGVFKVILQTNTPGFKTFLANIDNKGKCPVSDTFNWNLHLGKNSLQVYSQNNADRVGAESSIVFEWQK